jgi:hypothetical protein
MKSERGRHVQPFSEGPRHRGQQMPTLSVFPKAAHHANSTAADVATLVADFNALLAKLIAAGLMASS